MIIGLLGKAGSGKSTAANYILENFAGRRFGLADPLKSIARDVLDFTEEQLYGTQEQKETVDPRYGFTPRWFLQRLGTEGIRRHLGQDVWVQATLKAIADWRAAGGIGPAVIDDCRFPNEVEKLWKAGAKVVKLVCPDAVTKADGAHASEVMIDAVHHEMLADIIVSPRTPGSIDLLHKLAQTLHRMGL